MKIALMHDSILPPKTYGGIERIVVSLAHEYKRLGHQVLVVCRKGSELKDFEIFELPNGYQDRQPRSWLPNDVDFLHAHQPLPIKPDLPFLVTIHGNGHPHEKYWRNTNFLSRSHCYNHNGKFFVYNGVDPSCYPFVEKKEDYFVFLARASWRVKNLRTCVELANELGIRLEVMGGAGISTKYVRYHGTIGDADGKLEILSRARALIYPTNWDEPCAVAPLEALACGTPVISSVNGCMPELVRPGTGILCRSYEDLLTAPNRLFSADPFTCRRSVENYFSVRRMALDYLSLIEQIVEEGELEQQPRYNFSPESVQYVFKPNPINRIRLMVTGRV